MSEGGRSEASFAQFVGGFAFQTLVHLGKMPNPVSGATGVDLANAKYSIDLLAILQEKTKGNLSPEEEEQLTGILRDLRLTYVEVAGKKPDGQEKTAAPAGQGES